jgi:hypothetical protein
MLLREWDPIGVEGIREAAAEYYSYIWQVTGLLRSLHVTTNRLADVNHLVRSLHGATVDQNADMLYSAANSESEVAGFSGALATLITLGNRSALPEFR